jgi:hypothetical protein
MFGEVSMTKENTIEEILENFETWCLCGKDDCLGSIYFVHAVRDVEREKLKGQITELKRIEIGGDKIWTVDKGTDTAMLISERISELQAQLEGK